MNSITQYIRRNWLILILVALVINFLLSALQGNAGLFRYIQLSGQIERQTEIHEELRAERIELENKTKRLSDDFLDLDLLDEQARKRLGLVREDELIIE